MRLVYNESFEENFCNLFADSVSAGVGKEVNQHPGEVACVEVWVPQLEAKYKKFPVVKKIRFHH